MVNTLMKNNVIHMADFFNFIRFPIRSLVVYIQTCHNYVFDKPNNSKHQQDNEEKEVSI